MRLKRIVWYAHRFRSSYFVVAPEDYYQWVLFTSCYGDPTVSITYDLFIDIYINMNSHFGCFCYTLWSASTASICREILLVALFGVDSRLLLAVHRNRQH